MLPTGAVVWPPAIRVELVAAWAPHPTAPSAFGETFGPKAPPRTPLELPNAAATRVAGRSELTAAGAVPACSLQAPPFLAERHAFRPNLQ